MSGIGNYLAVSEGIALQLNGSFKIATAPAAQLSRLCIRGVLLVALLGPLGAATSPAHADSKDEEFLAALRSQGITYQSAAAAIAAGHSVCTELDQGRTPNQVAQDVMNASNLDGFHAGYFVGASIGAYCAHYAAES